MVGAVAGELDGCNVIVTGGSSGLGRAIAVEAARRGARNLILNFAHDTDAAEATAGAVEAAGARVWLVQGDIGSEEVCRRIAAAARPLGRADALFNNAGRTTFTEHQGDMDALTGDDFVDTYRVNVVGAYQMVRAARGLLEAGRPGSVVNTASLAGVTGIGSSVAYAASKGALITMTLSLARALAPGIRVNAVCPGFMDTPWFGRGLSEDAIAATRDRVRRAAPLQVLSRAEDVASSAVFLASPRAAHITGETLLVDAGAHLNLTPMVAR